MGFFMDKTKEKEFWKQPEIIIKQKLKKKTFSIKEVEKIINCGDTYEDFYQAVAQVMAHG